MCGLSQSEDESDILFNPMFPNCGLLFLLDDLAANGGCVTSHHVRIQSFCSEGLICALSILPRSI